MRHGTDLRDKLCDDLLDDFRREYQDAMETWRILEAKGQVFATVGGVFLAAAFAFARDLSALGLANRVLLAASLVLLVGVVFLALAVFRVAPTKKPPLGLFTDHAVFDLLGRPDDEMPAYVRRFAKDRATQWRDALQDIESLNDRKATWVRRSQACLVLAVVVTGLFTIIRIVQ